MVTLACDLDLFASSIPTSLAAIFLARGCFTKTRDMRALCLLLICHLLPPLLQFSFLFLSIGELVLRHHTLHAAFQTWQLAQCKLFFTIRPVPGRKGVQGATLSRREDALEAIGSISETAHARATYGISLETPLFQWQRCLAPCMPCNG